MSAAHALHLYHSFHVYFGYRIIIFQSIPDYSKSLINIIKLTLRIIKSWTDYMLCEQVDEISPYLLF